MSIATREVRFFGEQKYLTNDGETFMSQVSPGGVWYPSRQVYERGATKVFWRYLRDREDVNLIAGMEISHATFHWTCNPEFIGHVLARLRGIPAFTL